VLALSALAIGCVRPATSVADGDPASDVLLAQDAFFPYEPRVNPALEAALNETLRVAARATGLHLKVAIIGAPLELGLVRKLFGHPQAYARFLDQEITFNDPQPLLVVMPAGVGVVPASLARTLSRLRVDTQQRSDGLTRSAILAVVAIARAQGHPIAVPSLSPSHSSGSPPAWLAFGLPAVLLALGGLLFARRRAA
jgi:hypothetical protein